MFLGFSKKQLLGWGLLASGLKVAMGLWVVRTMGLHLPWS
tara:strand:+ start:1454 stop:1573 length:120 start_codon:yes stop_codon:yes gene_type:complete